jgi:hypothetical protein
LTKKVDIRHGLVFVKASRGISAESCTLSAEFAEILRFCRNLQEVVPFLQKSSDFLMQKWHNFLQISAESNLKALGAYGVLLKQYD